MKRTTLTVVFLIFAGLMSVVFMRHTDSQAAFIPFDQSIWTDDEAIHRLPNPRRLMIEDVLSNHLKAGMTRQEVITLLGKPTETPHFRDRDLVYWLGNEEGYVSIDSAWLVIDLDGTDAVEGFEKVTD